MRTEPKYESFGYYFQGEEIFGRKRNFVKLIIGILLVAFAISVFVIPETLKIPAEYLLYAKIGAGILAIIGAFTALLSIEIIHIPSGATIGGNITWKFKSEKHSLEEVLDAFYDEDFSLLDTFETAHNNPTQLFIYKNPKGEEVYVGVMNYYSTSDFRLASNILTISKKDDPENYAILINAKDRFKEEN